MDRHFEHAHAGQRSHVDDGAALGGTIAGG